MNSVTELKQVEREREELLKQYELDEESIKNTKSKIAEVTYEESEKLGVELYNLIYKKKYSEATDYEKIEELVYKGANVNYKNPAPGANKGNFPLIFCSRRGNLKTFLLLVRAGANINQTNNYCTTCCMASARHNQSEILKILIALGADINACCYDGDNAIISAKRNNSVECFDLLVEAQAKLNHKNFVGESITRLEHKSQEVSINPEKYLLPETYTESSLIETTEEDAKELLLEACEKLEAFELLFPPENSKTKEIKQKIFQKK